jgi:hypothetical protein
MGTPLTEEKFNEYLVIFEKRMSGLETRIDKIEIRMDKMERTLLEIKGFQDNEAKAIEYELKKILEDYLKKTYQLNHVVKFEMKRIYDQFDKEITELDAAFLIKPLEIKHDYSRLRDAGVRIRYEKNSLEEEKCIFVLAEAKHHITIKKVKYKLHQFHRICQMFTVARNVIENKVNKRAYSATFIRTVERNDYLGKIDTQYLYFGAAYWEDGLLDTLQEVIAEYKKLSAEFADANKERKIAIYHRLCKIESEWYVIHNPVLTNAEIENLTRIDSIYNYVDFIVPSGQRYHIASPIKNEPEGFPAQLRVGGSQTRKHKRESNE